MVSGRTRQTSGQAAASFPKPAHVTNDFERQFELERRFLVADTAIVEGADWEMITQAYVFSNDGYAIRVRRVQKATGQDLDIGHAWLTAKGPRAGIKREEYDVEISPLFAHEVIERSEHVVRKRRYQVMIENTWEVDQFLDDNAGLWIAELEGGMELLEIVQPPWAARELKNERRFNNDELAVRPFITWSDRDKFLPTAP